MIIPEIYAIFYVWFATCTCMNLQSEGMHVRCYIECQVLSRINMNHANCVHCVFCVVRTSTKNCACTYVCLLSMHQRLFDAIYMIALALRFSLRAHVACE